MGIVFRCRLRLLEEVKLGRGWWATMGNPGNVFEEIGQENQGNRVGLNTGVWNQE